MMTDDFILRQCITNTHDMRKKTLQSLLFLCLLCSTALYLTCTTENKDIETGESYTNKNANDARQYPEAARLEMPRLRGSVVDMFLVKRIGSDINFCIEWDKSRKAQRWTAFRWDINNSGGYVKREDEFYEDYEIPEEFRTSRANYSGSGYTRGHICASADRWNSLEHNRQTFIYSNMQPQLYDFNGGIWAVMEAKVRTWKPQRATDTLYVAKGGTIYGDQVLQYTSTGLYVPKYFFMAVLAKNSSATNGGYKAIGFWIEHRGDYGNTSNVSPYIVSIDRLEELTGIDFFCNLPDEIENQVEANVIPAAWGMN